MINNIVDLLAEYLGENAFDEKHYNFETEIRNNVYRFRFVIPDECLTSSLSVITMLNDLGIEAIFHKGEILIERPLFPELS